MWVLERTGTGSLASPSTRPGMAGARIRQRPDRDRPRADGVMRFTERGAKQIGRIAMTGDITE
jgi:hypothetical protein